MPTIDAMNPGLSRTDGTGRVDRRADDGTGGSA